MFITKKKVKCKILSHRFCLFDSGAMKYLLHLSLKYPRIKMPSARLLNQVNIIFKTEL